MKSFRKTLPIFALLLTGGAHAALTYVDVSTTNTVAALSQSAAWSATPPATPGGNGNDGLWGFRSTGPGAVSFGATAYEMYISPTDSTVATTNNIAILQTTITGLQANTLYSGLRIYFVSKMNAPSENPNDRDWGIQASVTGATSGFSTYRASNSTQLANSTTNALGTIATGGAITGNDARYFHSLPNAVTDASGNLKIWFTFADANRSVIDGFAYDNVAVPEPTSLALFGSALLGGLMIRRRR